MANFSPPFSSGTDRRFPTTDERNNGFDCGPADRDLFHGLFFRIESELGNVINEAGLTQTDTDMTLLLQAIKQLIAAAIPEEGEEPSVEYLLMSQARARLPIFPEVIANDGLIPCTVVSTGTIRVPGGVSFMHRGIFIATTTQTDFPTEASRTYHIRWNPTDGVVIRSLSDPAYNPGTLAETNPVFDSSYDDMLIARVVTNSANVATITNLRNKQKLFFTYSRDPLRYARGILNTPAIYLAAQELIPYNFARTPLFFMNGFGENDISESGTDGMETNIRALTISRYAGNVLTFSHNSNTGYGGRPAYTATFMVP